jgi:DNA replication protein DnaC
MSESPARTYRTVIPDAFTEARLAMCGGFPYLPFPARWVGEGRAELNDATISLSTTWDFRQRVKSEASWSVTPSARPSWESLSPEERMMVSRGELLCPCCVNGNASPVYLGQNTGIEITIFTHCWCKALMELDRVWRRDVPKRFQSCSLSTLVPSPVSKLPIERQAVFIDLIRQYKDDSILLVGDGGIGKTHMSFALHRYALLKWATVMHERGICTPSVLRASVPELVKQHRAYEMRSDDNPVPAPAITTAKIKAIYAEGNSPTVILDELDKLGNVTDTKMTVLFELVNTCYEYKGQLIATSNLDGEALRYQWSKDLDKSAAQLASTIVRRIGDDEGAHTLEIRL